MKEILIRNNITTLLINDKVDFGLVMMETYMHQKLQQKNLYYSTATIISYHVNDVAEKTKSLSELVKNQS